MAASGDGRPSLSVFRNEGHVMHILLPSFEVTGYALLPRADDRIVYHLPTGFTGKAFIVGMVCGP